MSECTTCGYKIWMPSQGRLRMADFCHQCSIKLFGEDFGDLRALMPKEKYSADTGAAVICEDCGPTVVDFDGKCIATDCKNHAALSGPNAEPESKCGTKSWRPLRPGRRRAGD